MTNAMQGLGTGNRAGKPAERKQEIMTPEYIREAVLRTWPGGIALGPAGNEASIMGCARQYLLSREEDGLKLPWEPYSFINPPFKFLKKWLAKGEREPKEQIWLVPNRTGRKWFRRWRNELDAYLELDPVKFHGYALSAPWAMLLGYSGWNELDFREATRGLGQYWYKAGAGTWVSETPH
jgi:hypothetical protein